MSFEEDFPSLKRHFSEADWFNRRYDASPTYPDGSSALGERWFTEEEVSTCCLDKQRVREAIERVRDIQDKDSANHDRQDYMELLEKELGL